MDFDWSVYKGNLQWLSQKALLLTKHGSHAYGMARPDSDLDIKGIAVPPTKYFHGFVNKFEQAESINENIDLVIYDIRKFFFLAANNNPNIIEVLFTDPSDHYTNIPFYNVFEKYLLPNRELFLSQRTRHTFSGYAHAQLKRIETHRRWLLNPPTHKPLRTEYGLPERTAIPKDQIQAATSLITKKIDQWQVDLEFLDDSTRFNMLNNLSEWLEEMKLGADERFLPAGRVLGYNDNFLEIIDKERAYKNALTNWTQYNNWKIERNPLRAELEAKHSFDTKHGSHLVRLIRMAEEILTTGKVLVKRPDAQELLAIRAGEWSYEKVVAYAKDMDSKLNDLANESPLPKKPPINKIDDLCMQIVEEINR